MQTDEKPRSRYLVGVDLGTTNSAVAYIDTRERSGETPVVRTFDEPQLGQGDPNAPPCPHPFPPAHDACRATPPAEVRRPAVASSQKAARVPARLVTTGRRTLSRRIVRRIAWRCGDDVARLSRSRPDALPRACEAWNRDCPRRRGEPSGGVNRPGCSRGGPQLTPGGGARVSPGDDDRGAAGASTAWIVAHESSWRTSPSGADPARDAGGGTTDHAHRRRWSGLRSSGWRRQHRPWRRQHDLPSRAASRTGSGRRKPEPGRGAGCVRRARREDAR
jgi:hypothetical protein